MMLIGINGNNGHEHMKVSVEEEAEVMNRDDEIIARNH